MAKKTERLEKIAEHAFDTQFESGYCDNIKGHLKKLSSGYCEELGNFNEFIQDLLFLFRENIKQGPDKGTINKQEITSLFKYLAKKTPCPHIEVFSDSDNELGKFKGYYVEHSLIKSSFEKIKKNSDFIDVLQLIDFLPRLGEYYTEKKIYELRPRKCNRNIHRLHHWAGKPFIPKRYVSHITSLQMHEYQLKNNYFKKTYGQTDVNAFRIIGEDIFYSVSLYKVDFDAIFGVKGLNPLITGMGRF
jgi:hypothetical protein